LEQLYQLYQHLLLAAGGDVERALRWLQEVARRYQLMPADLSLEDLRQQLLRRGEVQPTPTGSLKLSRAGEVALRRDSLELVFRGLTRGSSGVGEHRSGKPGEGTKERLSETRAYEFGDDPADLDWTGSVLGALQRSGSGNLELREEDLAVFETEATTSCATVIAIDISHSMTLYGEDRITPAKRVALALVELIRTRFRRDELAVVAFGDRAKEIPIPSIPYLQNGPYHTNTREALELAAGILARKKHPNRQILMITDGKPSALSERGRLYKNPMGLDRRIVNKTLEMAAILRRKGVVVTTFMLTDDPYLVSFVEDFTRLNRGRAYYSRPDQLGSFLFVDYLRNRRRRVH
jgi:uncharacterized protein with von Willebrand factor type A (vWA) domain